jgi:hypothetical protein
MEKRSKRRPVRNRDNRSKIQKIADQYLSDLNPDHVQRVLESGISFNIDHFRDAMHIFRSIRHGFGQYVPDNKRLELAFTLLLHHVMCTQIGESKNVQDNSNTSNTEIREEPNS